MCPLGGLSSCPVSPDTVTRTSYRPSTVAVQRHTKANATHNGHGRMGHINAKCVELLHKTDGNTMRFVEKVSDCDTHVPSETTQDDLFRRRPPCLLSFWAGIHRPCAPNCFATLGGGAYVSKVDNKDIKWTAVFVVQSKQEAETTIQPYADLRVASLWGTTPFASAWTTEHVTPEQSRKPIPIPSTSI